MTQYRYSGFSWRSLLWRELNIGWLDKAHPFSQGDVPDGFLDRLFDFSLRPIRHMRGFHTCQFCSTVPEMGIWISRNERIFWVGSAEIRVRGRGRILYAAPNMVYHYIESHRYVPPREFIEVVMK